MGQSWATLLIMLMFQVFVNVGMNVRIMPITGVTLPLMSYGGASVLSTFIALYNYGYRNVWELGPVIDVKKTKLPLEPTKMGR